MVFTIVVGFSEGFRDNEVGVNGNLDTVMEGTVDGRKVGSGANGLQVGLLDPIGLKFCVVRILLVVHRKEGTNLDNE